MSNLAAILLILATLCFAYVVIIYASNKLNEHVDVIIAGVIQGVPASTKHRYIKLNQIFLPQAAAVFVFSLIMALGYIRIADNVSDPDVRTVAYLAACLGAFGAASWLVLGVSFYVHCYHVLRQETRE